MKTVSEIKQNEISNNSALVANSLRSMIHDRLPGHDNISVLNETFGYKPDLSYEDYYNAYKRQPLAKRIIDATVDFTWKNSPTIIDEEEDANSMVLDDETEDSAESDAEARQRRLKEVRTRIQAMRRKRTTHNLAWRTENAKIRQPQLAVDTQYTMFEEAVFQLFRKFNLLKILKKVDRLNCIGRYSILLIGVANEDLKTPLDIKTTHKLDDIIYINAYSEKEATVQTWNTDTKSPNYGMPEVYQISPSAEDGATLSLTSFTVHASRVIHIAEDQVDSKVYGTPRLEAVFNALQDILKVVGGSAEMFWLGAYQGIVFNVKDGYSLDKQAADDIQNQIDNFTSKLQRFMKTKGIEVQTISAPTANPDANFNVLIKLVSSASNIPTRILIGSEQGQLAASVDQDTFFSYITSRRNSFVNDDIIKQLIDKLVNYGFIPAATNNEYYIEWPPLFEQTQAEKIQNATNIILALKNATVDGNTLDLTAVEEIRELLGLSQEIPETKYNDVGSGLDDYFMDTELNEDEEFNINENEYDNTLNDYVSVETIANYLNISNGTVRTYTKLYGLPYYKVGNRYKFRLQEVENWMQDNNA